MIAAAPALAAPGSVPLPPSGRDFEVYRRTAVEGRTTREAAAEFNLSQTRVVQLRAKVFEWIGMHLPPLARLSPAERLRVAETLACEQLQQQYEEAMEAWRKSATEERSTRLIGGSSADSLTVLKESQGNPKYLRVATQISKAIAKIGMATMPDPETAIPVASLASGTRECPGETANVAPSSNEPAASEPVAQDHPLGDCSNSESLGRPVETAATTASAAKSGVEGRSPVAAGRKVESLTAEIDAIETVQAMVERLDNVPHKTRRERQREVQIRRELFGAAPPLPKR
jgi:hypothetical protein